MFDYQTNLETIRGILVDHNTITASPDLSASLGSFRIEDDNIRIGDPEIQTIEAMKTHTIFIRVSDKDEDFASLGPTGAAGVRKMAEVNYQVIGFFMKDGGIAPHEDMLTGAYNLARNIEGVFREKYNLSGTALKCNPVNTDFYGPFDVEGSWMKTVVIKLKASYLFR